MDGPPVVVQEGTELPDTDPVVKANPDMFGKTPAKKTSAKRPTKKGT